MKPLVIFEMANNHMGDISHAKKIINTYSKISSTYKSKIDFAFKFQFRELDTYIHSDFKDNDHPQVKRFLETKLSSKDWTSLINFCKKRFKTIQI